MPFYEITYETGRTSVAFYEDDAEMESAVGAHDSRARNGEPGGPVAGHGGEAAAIPNWSAERIAKVRVYDKHPNELNAAQTMSAEVVEKEIKDLIKGLADDNGVVPVDALAVEVRALTHPMIGAKEHPHDSIFLMKEDREADLVFLEGSK